MKRRKRVLSKTHAFIRAIKTEPTNNIDEEITRFEQVLLETDKLVVVYKSIGKGKTLKIIEITTVAFVTTINDKDFTVVFYDNAHNGFLHMHRRLSVNDKSESIVPIAGKKGGNQKKQLSWAIEEIRDRWYYFRSSFYKRSDIKSDF